MRRVIFLLTIALLYMILPVLPVSAAGTDFGQRVDGMAEITGVRVSSSEDKVRIVVDSNKPVAYKEMILANPDRVVVDIAKAWISDKVKREPGISSQFVGKVRLAQHDPQTVRVVVETKVGKNNYKVFALKGGTAPGRLVLDFGNIGPDSSQAAIKLPATKPATKPVTKPAAQEETKPATKPVTKPATKPVETKPATKPETKPETPAINKPADEAAKPQSQPADKTDTDIASITGLKDKKITIDAGHGGNDSGAIGPTGIMEKSVTLRVANEVKRLLTAQGATVFMTRETDKEVSPKGAKASDIEELQARCDVANQNNSDVFVSIHMDSFSSGAAKGTTGYYYSLGSAKSRDLADKVRSGVIDQIGTQSRGTQSCNFYVVKHTDMPATLVEVAFISNESEEKLMDSEEGIKKAAQGIVDGIADFFG